MFCAPPPLFYFSVLCFSEDIWLFGSHEGFFPTKIIFMFIILKRDSFVLFLQD